MTSDVEGIRAEPVVEAQGREVTVLVTGYGPFLDKFPVNVSWSIASTLPRYLAPTAALPVPIRIVIPDRPLRVSYAQVASIAPRLLAGTYRPADDEDRSSSAYYAGAAGPSVVAEPVLPRPDMVVHIGLAAGRNFYTLERQAPRGPFDQIKDVDGQIFPACRANRLFGSCPAVLKPTYDTDDVWRRWRTNVQDLAADLRLSDDPGRYLCGFIYYVSMSWYMQHKLDMKGERPVIFLHVPNLPSEALVAQGREVVIGLIKAMVASRLKLGVVDPLQPADQERDAQKVFAWSGVEDFTS